jgi:hypothetical protein
MKVAIVLGFFDPVLVRLQKEHSSRIQDQSIVWIGVTRPHGDADLHNFKVLLGDRLATGPSELLVLAVVKRGKEFTVGKAIDNLCMFAKERYPNVVVSQERFSYAGQEDGVIKKLGSFFEIPQLDEIFPESLEDIEAWCKAQLGENIFLHPRALDAAKKSLFADVPLVYKCLRLLGEEYRANRLDGGPKTRHKLGQALGKVGVAISKSISIAVAKQRGDEYFVHYPLEQPLDKKEFLDLHVKKGVDHDERTCLRIYFFWDKSTRRVVIGWLTSHLGTNAN